jgi:hypothetical protein
MSQPHVDPGGNRVAEDLPQHTATQMPQVRLTPNRPASWPLTVSISQCSPRSTRERAGWGSRPLLLYGASRRIPPRANASVSAGDQ